MKSWIGVAAMLTGFVAGAVALIAGSVVLWVVAALLLLAGVALETSAGWGAGDTTSQHATDVGGSGTAVHR